MMAVRPAVSYIPCATSSRGGNGNKIKFTQFGEGNLLSVTCYNAEIGDKSNEDSIIPQLIS